MSDAQTTFPDTAREATFRSQSTTDGAPGYRERAGQRVTVLGPIDADADLAADEDVAAIYRVRFEDGVETEAFADELDPAPEHAGA